ncbi:MAG: complex I subunit 5 family protein [Halobacteriaceae archaeon]
MSVATVVVTPMLVALVAAVSTLLTGRWPRLQTALSLAGVLAYAAAVAALSRAVLAGGVLTYQVGRWPAPFGISLVADALSAFMLSLAAVVAVASLVFSVRYVDPYGQRLSYHALFHFMLLGVSGAFLTGDVFNLFVWFEVMLMSSYVLVVFYSGPEQTSAALRYVVLNLLGSAVMLVAIGGLYATTGTLNMADIARRIADPGAYGVAVGPVLGLSAVLFAVFALKAGVVPFQFWVPAAYRAAPSPVAAMLAGVVKKVGVYAMVRLLFTVLAGADLAVRLGPLSGGMLAFYAPVLLTMAAASILLGGVGAASRDSLPDVLSYSSISQVGFVVLPVGVAAATAGSVRTLAVVAALVYALNHALSKGLLFLVTGVVRDATGAEEFAKLGGLAGRFPWLAAAFFVGALALVGIPPLAGFFGKLLVFDAAVRAGATAALGVALFGAVLTIAYYTRAWNLGFWGEQTPLVEGATADEVQVAVCVALALAVVAVGLGFDPVYRFAAAGARAALDSQGYVTAVLGGGA